MARSNDGEALERTRIDIADLADAFRASAGAALEEALDRRVEALTEARSAWWDGLAPKVQAAFRSSVQGAVRAGVADAMRRLENEDVWLAPLVAPGISDDEGPGWHPELPDWVAGLLRRWAPRRRGPEVGDLDDPGNRIWLALISSARALDPVLEEFGLPPADVPRVGGGRYGIAPKTAEQLDPSGDLSRLWRRYRLAHRRYAALAPSAGTR